MLCIKIRRKIARQGGLLALSRNRARYAFSIAGKVLYPKTVRYDLRKVMEQFLIRKMSINELLQKGRDFHSNIKYIKRKFKDQYETRDEKRYVQYSA